MITSTISFTELIWTIIGVAGMIVFFRLRDLARRIQERIQTPPAGVRERRFLPAHRMYARQRVVSMTMFIMIEFGLALLGIVPMFSRNTSPTLLGWIFTFILFGIHGGIVSWGVMELRVGEHMADQVHEEQARIRARMRNAGIEERRNP